MENRMRVLRAERRMSQARLADLAGLSRATVNRVERGNHLPDAATILKIAGALGCPAADVFVSLATV